MRRAPPSSATAAGRAGLTDATALIRIEDDGPGIPEGEIARMMEPFTRLEASPMGGADRDIFWRIGRQEVGRFIKERMILADRRKYFEMELKLGEEK